MDISFRVSARIARPEQLSRYFTTGWWGEVRQAIGNPSQARCVDHT